MNSLIRRPGYSDRFDRGRKRFALAFPDAAQFLQSHELNEMQSLSDDKLRRVAEYILQDGRKVDGGDPVVSAIAGDAANISIRLPASSVYIGGLVHDVAERTFVLAATADLSIGVRLAETVEDHVSDPDLRGPLEGTESHMEPGAARIRLEAAWGHSGDGNANPLVPVFTMRGGTILTLETNTDLSEIYQAIEGYSRESNGSFVNAGCMVSALGLDAGGKQQFAVSEGTAYVNGRRIVRNQNMRFTIVEEPTLLAVSAEPHTFTMATNGTQTFTLFNGPIADVQEITIVREVTENVVHGVAGAADQLAHSSVESVIEVKQGATSYASPASYTVNAGRINWAPAGAEPAPGSAYTVKYRYYDNIQPDAFSRATVTVAGAASGTNILVDYRYKLPRMDAVVMDMNGDVLYLKGVPATQRPKAPAVPSTHLELARVSNLWGIVPIVTPSAVFNITYAELTDMREAILDLYDLVAQERLKSDVSYREPAAKRGVFVDPFLDDDMRDQGIPQTAASFGGALQLPIHETIHEFPALTRLQMLDFTEEVIVSQLRETGEMKINPYKAFTPMPGAAWIEPSTDIWTETDTVWSSPKTATFDPPDRGPKGNNVTITSVSLDASVKLIESKTVEAKYVRQRSVNFRLYGYIEEETLAKVRFDGDPVLELVHTPADVDGVITGSFKIPPKIPQGSKTVAFTGSVGTGATATYVGRGTITTEEYRLSTALRGTTAELPKAVNNITTVVNNTTVVQGRGGRGSNTVENHSERSSNSHESQNGSHSGSNRY